MFYEPLRQPINRKTAMKLLWTIIATYKFKVAKGSSSFIKYCLFIGLSTADFLIWRVENMGQNIYLSIRIYKYIHENEHIFIWHEIFETRV